ncbi:hypothetical protein C1J01_28795 [Nonomuraea aridisoli]|uniref:Transposase DDE domain-containing protein n=1 Tax=Nonomuraea aridisoli TaxID=2070368 RepID=A0A2W2DTG0_9ACTN|nr:hypothetical protein C1J01_28795 [Nonomuraea aridisoli]
MVERTLAWLTARRRLARDYERDPAASEAIIRWAAVAGMARRLTRRRARPTTTALHLRLTSCANGPFERMLRPQLGINRRHITCVRPLDESRVLTAQPLPGQAHSPDPLHQNEGVHLPLLERRQPRFRCL